MAYAIPDLGYIVAQRTVTSSDTVGPTDYMIFIDTSLSDVTLTLPTAVGKGGRSYKFKIIDITNDAEIAPSFGETIEVETIYTFKEINECVTVMSDNTTWYLI